MLDLSHCLSVTDSRMNIEKGCSSNAVVLHCLMLFALFPLALIKTARALTGELKKEAPWNY